MAQNALHEGHSRESAERRSPRRQNKKRFVSHAQQAANGWVYRRSVTHLQRLLRAAAGCCDCQTFSPCSPNIGRSCAPTQAHGPAVQAPWLVVCVTNVNPWSSCQPTAHQPNVTHLPHSVGVRTRDRAEWSAFDVCRSRVVYFSRPFRQPVLLVGL